MKPIWIVLALTAAAVGCEGSYRVYDSSYSDYHTWNHGEVVYYNQWAGETHRDPHRDFRKLSSDDQKEYWKWRHEHH